MIKRLFLLISIFCMSNMFGTDYSFFKYDIHYSDRDYFSGEPYTAGSKYENLQCKKKIKCIAEDYMRIRDKGYDAESLEKEVTEKRTIKNFFNEKGLHIRTESKYRDFDWIEKKYNKDDYYAGYITNYDSDGEYFIYTSENQRECYKNNGQFKYRQIIENSDNEYYVTTERIDSKTNETYVAYTLFYSYEKQKIMQYECTTYTVLGEEHLYSVYEFEYDLKNNLKKVIYTTMNLIKDEEVGHHVISFDYDKNGYIKKITDKNLKRAEESSVSEYSNYDKYGNWHNVKTYCQGRLSSETNRTIEYRE